MHPTITQLLARSRTQDLIRTAGRFRRAADAIGGPTPRIVIREAGIEDGEALGRLAQLDSHRLPAGAALIGELPAGPAAALFLSDCTVVADPFVATSEL